MIPELRQAIGQGPVHFIGIGGISMSGLARILLDQGIPVTGSDRVESDALTELTRLGATIGVPHHAGNISGQSLVVYTAAIPQENPELAAAREKGIPVMDRGHFLGLLARGYARTLAVAGTHGKTTSTGMAGCILLAAQIDPTIHIGGVLPAIRGNTRSGGPEWFLMEACEYKNSYHSFYPTHALVLNIEADHLDFFRDLDDILDSFSRFARNLPPQGQLVLNLGDEGCLALARRIHRSYAGFSVLQPGVVIPSAGTNARVPPDNPLSAPAPATLYEARSLELVNGCGHFEAWKDGCRLATISLQVPGIHNVHNAIGCFALAHLAGIAPDVIAQGLAAFTGTGRRFEYKGTARGARVYDDYAHHPSEINATINTARLVTAGRVLCVFQPHTYTRTRELFRELALALASADQTVLVDIYAAREPDLGQVHARDLAAAVGEAGGSAAYASSFEEAVQRVLAMASPSDCVLVMGAGDVSRVADQLVQAACT